MLQLQTLISVVQIKYFFGANSYNYKVLKFSKYTVVYQFIFTEDIFREDDGRCEAESEDRAC